MGRGWKRTEPTLTESISDSMPNTRAVIDGEICSLDRRGEPQFKNLMFRRGNPPCFFAFDLLTCDGKDLRTERLLDRKQELRRLLAKTSPPVCIAICGACGAFRHSVISASPRIGLGGSRCEAEVRALRHGPR